MNQPPQKILFLITKATWGGAQRYVYDLATNLPKDQCEVSVAYGQGGLLEQKLKDQGIRLYPLSSLNRDVVLSSDVTSFVQMLALLRQTRPDVIHVNSSKAAALGALAARMIGIKRIIFTAHGWPFKEDRGTIAKAVIYLITWFTAFLSHVTIVVSKRDETIGKQMPFVGKKMYYIPLGIDPPTFLSREEASAALSITTTHTRITSIGELTHNKGHRYAIDAIAMLKNRGIDVEYFILGEGELRAQLEKQARDQRVDDRVYFLGFVGNGNAAQYLKAFDLFLLPSLKEGMPYVLLEARAAGLPIVATDIIDGYTTKQRDAGALVSMIEQTLFEHRELRAANSTASAQDMARATAELY